MATPRDDNRSSEFIGVLKNEHMKTHAVRDVSQRVILLYEAPRHVGHNEPCLVTVYEYFSSNNVPENTLEKTALWNIAWNTNTEAVLVNGDVGYVE
jgi:hypothetical protein